MKQNLTTKTVRIDDNSVVIKKFIKGIEGGRTLDVSDFSEDVIKAGHVIITDGNGNYKPLGVKDGSYVALPDGFHYVGVAYSTIEKDKAACPIMTWGIVNSEAIPFPLTAKGEEDECTSFAEAFKKDCPHIDFQKDEEA